jgi:hypothetical protein
MCVTTLRGFRISEDRKHFGFLVQLVKSIHPIIASDSIWDLLQNSGVGIQRDGLSFNKCFLTGNEGMISHVDNI